MYLVKLDDLCMDTDGPNAIWIDLDDPNFEIDAYDLVLFDHSVKQVYELKPGLKGLTVDQMKIKLDMMRVKSVSG